MLRCGAVVADTKRPGHRRIGTAKLQPNMRELLESEACTAPDNQVETRFGAE